MDTEELQKKIIKFRNDRDWKQFHTPKNIAISLMLEAAELLEIFQWVDLDNIKKKENTEKYQRVKEELADIYYWVLLMAHDLEIDIGKEFLKKMKQNEKKYPVAKAKGSHKKYTEL